MTDDDIRRMLQRRAGDVSPAPDGWEAIEARLGEAAPARSRSRSRLALLAAVLVVLVGVAAVAVSRPDRTERVALVPAAGQADGSSERPVDGTGGATSGVAGETPDQATATTVPTPAGPPGATAVPTSALTGAPMLRIVSAVATERQGEGAVGPQLWTGTITLAFDQPVNPGEPMYLAVFEDDATCGSANGNSHRVISGAGSPTLTLDATSLTAPTSYIIIVPGFVTSAGSGTPNERSGCIAVPTAVRPAPTTTTMPHPPGPVLVSAVAAVTERQGGYAAGTITVTFDQPVNLAGSDTLVAMRLVVFGDDATCATPAGNSHMVISGAGRPTLTLDATSLATPATYIALAPGFVTSVRSGVANEPLGCTAVPTTG